MFWYRIGISALGPSASLVTAQCADALGTDIPVRYANTYQILLIRPAGTCGLACNDLIKKILTEMKGKVSTMFLRI